MRKLDVRTNTRFQIKIEAVAKIKDAPIQKHFSYKTKMFLQEYI